MKEGKQLALTRTRTKSIYHTNTSDYFYRLRNILQSYFSHSQLGSVQSSRRDNCSVNSYFFSVNLIENSLEKAIETAFDIAAKLMDVFIESSRRNDDLMPSESVLFSRCRESYSFIPFVEVCEKNFARSEISGKLQISPYLSHLSQLVSSRIEYACSWLYTRCWVKSRDRLVSCLCSSRATYLSIIRRICSENKKRRLLRMYLWIMKECICSWAKTHELVLNRLFDSLKPGKMRSSNVLNERLLVYL